MNTTIFSIILAIVGGLGCIGLTFWTEYIRRKLTADRTRAQRELHRVKADFEELERNYRETYQAWETRDRQVNTAQSQVQELDRRCREQAAVINRLQSDASVKASFKTQRYRIVTIGMPKSGKTSLTLQWANPLWELRNVQGTSFDRYSRTVSSVISPDNNVVVNHVFEVFDYGGERLVDAHDAMVVDDIHGVLFVVDLAGSGATEPDPARIEAQIREFHPTSLRFFFESPRVTKTCRTVVLFINKSDVLAGKPAEVERQARAYYAELIRYMEAFSDRIEFEVMVGSAVSGHNAHRLMPHFIRRLLPENAFDEQLMQKQNYDTLPPQLSVVDLPEDDWDDRTNA